LPRNGEDEPSPGEVRVSASGPATSTPVLLGASGGALLFGLAGALDSLGGGAGAGAVAIAALLFAGAGLAVGLAAATVLILALRVAGRPWPVAAAHAAAGGVALALWAVLGAYATVYLNRFLLIAHPWFAPTSLGTTGAALLVLAAGAGFVGRQGGRRLSASWSRAPTPTWLTLGAGALALGTVFGAAAVIAGFEPGAPTVRDVAHAAAAERPNIVIAISDAVRRDHVSAYGYGLETTPFFDRIAAEGMRFEDAHASSSWTLASVTGILASTQAGVDIRPGIQGTDLRATTLPEVLADLGYTTVAASNNPHLDGPFGLGSRFDVLYSGRTPLERALETTVLRLVRDRFVISDGTMVRRTIDRLEDIPRPFFLYLHILGGHSPYEPPSGYTPAFPIPETDRMITGPHRDMTITEEQRANLMARYDAMLRYADERIAALADALERRGELDDTILVYSSDHGEEFGDHGRWTHGKNLHAESVEVPLAVRWPGHVPAGAVRDDVVSLIDLGPSLLAAIGHEGAPDGWQGLNLHLTEATPPEVREAASAELGPGQRALVTRAWKLMTDEERGAGWAALYDRRADPDERDDVAAEHPEVVAELRALLESMRGAVAPIREAAPRADPALTEQLRALGYIE
jgi:arylsulfatase A-like enzyme